MHCVDNTDGSPSRHAVRVCWNLTRSPTSPRAPIGTGFAIVQSVMPLLCCVTKNRKRGSVLDLLDGKRQSVAIYSGVQSDEIWTFVGKKQRRVRDKDLNHQGPFCCAPVTVSLLYD